jgi:hypothetical protein
MMACKTSFVLYTSYASAINKLSNEEAGELFKAIFAYTNCEEVLNLSPCAGIAFALILDTLERDTEKWADTCRKRAEAGSKGGIASGASRAKQSQAN